MGLSNWANIENNHYSLTEEESLLSCVQITAIIRNCMSITFQKDNILHGMHYDKSMSLGGQKIHT